MRPLGWVGDVGGTSIWLINGSTQWYKRKGQNRLGRMKAAKKCGGRDWQIIKSVRIIEKQLADRLPEGGG